MPATRERGKLMQVRWLERDRSQMAGGVFAHTGEAGSELPGAHQRRLYVRHDVVCAHVLHELGLVKQRRRLPPRTAQDQ